MRGPARPSGAPHEARYDATNAPVSSRPRRSLGLRAFVATLLAAPLALELALRAHVSSRESAGSVPADLAARELYRESIDPVLRYEPIPNARVRAETGAEVAINARGFRGAIPAMPKPPDVERILMLGDSEALGPKLRDDETLAARLEDSLGARLGRRVEVVNFGVEGYDTEQETRLFELRGAALTPDVVILYFVSNDVLPPELVRVADRWDRSRVIRWARDARLMSRARRLFGSGNDYRAYVEHAYDPASSVWRAGRERVLQLRDRVEEAHARFAVVIAPEIFGIERREDLLDSPYRAFHHALASLETDGITVVDPLPALVDCAERPPDLWVTATDHHKNGRANGCIAEFLAASGVFRSTASHTEGP